VNTPEPVTLGQLPRSPVQINAAKTTIYEELMLRESVIAYLRELAEKATNHSSQLEDLREEVLRLVRVEGDET
jgi:hypothetical protein